MYSESESGRKPKEKRNMLKIAIYVVVSCYLSFLLTGLSYAEKVNEQTDLRLVITGNTVEGKDARSQTSYKIYFRPSGKLLRHNSQANFQKGNWRIVNKDGLCIKFAEEKCYTVKSRSDAEFDLYDVNGELSLTIDRVTLGNPEKYDVLAGNK